jgi:hypothetical protein
MFCFNTATKGCILIRLGCAQKKKNQHFDIVWVIKEYSIQICIHMLSLSIVRNLMSFGYTNFSFENAPWKWSPSGLALGLYFSYKLCLLQMFIVDSAFYLFLTKLWFPDIDILKDIYSVQTFSCCSLTDKCLNAARLRPSCLQSLFPQSPYSTPLPTDDMCQIAPL